MAPFVNASLALREVPAYVYDRDTVRKCAPPLPFSPPSGGIPLRARRRIIPILTPDTGIPACSMLPGRCGAPSTLTENSAAKQPCNTAWGLSPQHLPNDAGLCLPHRSVGGVRALIPAPKAHADARGPCMRPRTRFGNTKHPYREPRPIPGGWAGPTIPPSDQIPTGRV